MLNSLQIFGQLFSENLAPRSLKNIPIWSHWTVILSAAALNHEQLENDRRVQQRTVSIWTQNTLGFKALFKCFILEKIPTLVHRLFGLPRFL